MKNMIKKISFVKNWIRKLDSQNERISWVEKQLKSLQSNSTLLDAGCGSQRYRVFCEHLN